MSTSVEVTCQCGVRWDTRRVFGERYHPLVSVCPVVAAFYGPRVVTGL